MTYPEFESAEQAKAFLEEYALKRAEAAESLSEKTVDSLESLASLEEAELSVLLEDLSEAYSETDIDGYGDEGAGYDISKFAENLVKLGWVYNPVKSPF